MYIAGSSLYQPLIREQFHRAKEISDLQEKLFVEQNRDRAQESVEKAVERMPWLNPYR